MKRLERWANNRVLANPFLRAKLCQVVKESG